MTLYFLSGLGADRRLFGRLVLPERYRVQHLPWIPPLPAESLPAYALRMAERIDTSEPFAVVGMSFGGMLATEIAKVLQPWRTVLISSAATRRELPPLYRLLGAMGLDRIVPPSLFKTQNFLLDWLFGATDAETRSLLHALIRDTDASFDKWAVGAILSWHNRVLPPSLRRIHGRADKVLPPRRVNATHWIPGGGHLAVYAQADLVSGALRRCLEENG